MKKIISITLIFSLMFMTLALPVMALPAEGFEAAKIIRSIRGAEWRETAQQLRAGDYSSLTGLLELSAPWLNPEAELYADEIKAEIEIRQVSGGMADFLQYAGYVFLLISVVMILGGIQMVIDLSDIGEGLIDIILGVFFFVFAIMMLNEVEAEPAI